MDTLPATSLNAAPALNSDQLYEALLSRDARFDGHFFVGVTSTGVYCRPVCRVRTPKQANCRFFSNAAVAEHNGFRPCLKCRPELAPGLSLTDSPNVLADSAARLIEAGFLEHDNLTGLAKRIGITDRHLRRIFQDRFGVSPLDYAQTRRLLLAKQLLTQTQWPIAQVAHAAGFGSVRRLNDAFVQHYRLQPSALRKATDQVNGDASLTAVALAGDAISGLHLLIPMRAPFDVQAMFDFLSARAVTGIERVEQDPQRSYYRLQRSLQVGREQEVVTGTLQVQWMAQRHAFAVQLSPQLFPVASIVLERCRNVLDARCDPHAVANVLGPLVVNPGLRVPGTFDGFELAVRAILGQLVSVAAARTLVSRVAQAFGEPLPAQIALPQAGLTHVFPTPQRLAQLQVSQIAELGIVRTRAQAIIALAQQVADGQLELMPGLPVQDTIKQLTALPGIGQWTASYIAMRALAWPDTFLEGDLVVRKALSAMHGREIQATQARDMAQAWQPWRAYATIQLWARSGVQAQLSPVSETTTAGKATHKETARKTTTTRRQSRTKI